MNLSLHVPNKIWYINNFLDYQNYKNIHYYYKINGGQASARNLGLKHAKTEWITFIDPDDFVKLKDEANRDAWID